MCAAGSDPLASFGTFWSWIVGLDFGLVVSDLGVECDVRVMSAWCHYVRWWWMSCSDLLSPSRSRLHKRERRRWIRIHVGFIFISSVLQFFSSDSLWPHRLFFFGSCRVVLPEGDAPPDQSRPSTPSSGTVWSTDSSVSVSCLLALTWELISCFHPQIIYMIMKTSQQTKVRRFFFFLIFFLLVFHFFKHKHYKNKHKQTNHKQTKSHPKLTASDATYIFTYT